jgi:hypothetical protein
MDVKQKIMSAEEIRVELARRQISRKALSQATDIYYPYLIEILLGQRKAVQMRERITSYLKGGKAA